MNLTLREIEILDLLAMGLSYKDIGAQLKLSVGTVKQYVHTIYQKLDANNRTIAVIKYRSMIHPAQL